MTVALWRMRVKAEGLIPQEELMELSDPVEGLMVPLGPEEGLDAVLNP